jgi:uncharacterized membrane protein (DUF2068 family)
MGRRIRAIPSSDPPPPIAPRTRGPIIRGMERRADLVPAIGVFKLLKTSILVTAGVAMLLELPQQLGLQLEHGLHWLGIDAGRGTIQSLIERLWRLDAPIERRLAIFALAYAAVFLTEGIGLLLRRRWAEWMTVFVTASFIPFEVYELVQRFGPVKLLALVLNVAIVIYLVRVRLQDRASVRSLRPAAT